MQKVLIITYYWPPAGGPGVQRWLKFIKYLPEFQIEPIVFVPENPHYPLKDTSLEEEIPRGIQVLKSPIKEPYKIASFFSRKKTDRISSGIIQDFKKQSLLERIFLWIRGNLFIPDARKFWVAPSIKKLSKIIEQKQIDVVVTTGPPHSVHLIGKGLKEKLNIRWIADFRDPWTTIGYHKKLKLTKASKNRHKRLEKTVLSQADHLIVTSATTKLEFELLATTPISVITNGYDDDLQGTSIPDTSFTLSHIGSLLTTRNPSDLWLALSELISENDAFEKALQIQLIGVVGESVIESIKANGLENYLLLKGYVSHEEVLRYQSTSQILLLLEINSEHTKGIIPGKLFEYLNAQRPILAIGPKDWEAGELVKEHQAGDYVIHGNSKTIKKLLLERFNQFQAGALHCNAIGIEQYHRRELTKKMAKLLTWESS